ncbi:MAG: hypothetical protein Q7S58_02100 [Candidatus Binatus sp.]|uniref:hypothetical protein n=1 Tax=Candidatus Binatus sp. TaxID=2811406 RepID=UPI0027293CD7|nr:hypothetical protein [Candidatus Binatus sp.]MDO8431182.1 hypothetical protein [Candidatus Binatus sp.]
MRISYDERGAEAASESSRELSSYQALVITARVQPASIADDRRVAHRSAPILCSLNRVH